MKLHWSSRSPFVRKVMVAAHELGLANRIELVRTPVATTKPNSDLMRDNPLSKIPTLILDDGSPLYDSSAICQYFDYLDGRGRLFPNDLARQLVTWRRHACGNGFLDLLLLYRGERNRPPEQRSQDHLTAFAQKTSATLVTLEKDVEALAATPIDIGHIAIGCALSYLDFRFAEDPWRPAHPGLTRWHEGFASRPSMLATEPDDR